MSLLDLIVNYQPVLQAIAEPRRRRRPGGWNGERDKWRCDFPPRHIAISVDRGPFRSRESRVL